MKKREYDYKRLSRHFSQLSTIKSNLTSYFEKSQNPPRNNRLLSSVNKYKEQRDTHIANNNRKLTNQIIRIKSGQSEYGPQKTESRSFLLPIRTKSKFEVFKEKEINTMNEVK